MTKSNQPQSNPLEPFTKWQIISNDDGGEQKMTGYVYEGNDYAATRRYIDALADGLRRAGYRPRVTLTRSLEEVV